MNSKLYNPSYLNLRNIILIIGTFIFLGLSIFILFTQRTGYLYINDYTNTYIVIASLFIAILILSIAYLIVPIVLESEEKRLVHLIVNLLFILLQLR